MRHSLRPFTDSAVWLGWDSCEWSLGEEGGWIEGEDGGREGETAGGMVATSHYVSAVHQGNWSVCDSYCQDGGVMERRQEEEEMGRGRVEERRSLLSSLPSFSILPSLMSDEIQVTYSSS